MHCDRVFVFANGRLAESGQPGVLSRDKSSLFYELANASEESL